MLTISRVVAAVFAVIFAGSRTVFADPEIPRDVTTNPEYGCRWYGGSSASLVCICRSEVDDFYIEENSIPAYNLETIRIDSCSKVRFGPNSINRIRNLRLLEISNIRELTLEEGSLIWENYLTNADYGYQLEMPTLKIRIENCHINQISSYTFKGRIGEIRLKNLDIESVSAFAFSSLVQTDVVAIENSQLKNVQAQAFKKFATRNLQIIGTNVEFLPSRAFSEIQVDQEFLLQNCSFETVRPLAFFLSNPQRVDVEQNVFNQLDGEAFRITTRGNVIFKSNVFNNTNDYAFKGINLNANVPNRQTITFEHNTFNYLSRHSLTTSDELTPVYVNTVLNELCDCKRISNVYNSDYYAEIHCLAENGKVVTAEKYKSNCSIIESHATLIISVGVVLIVFVLVASGLVFYLRRSRNSDKYGKEKNGKNGKLSLIVPDGRTYRETELHVIVERADLLTTDL